MNKEKEQLVNDIVDIIKIHPDSDPTKTQGSRLRALLVDFVDSFYKLNASGKISASDVYADASVTLLDRILGGVTSDGDTLAKLRQLIDNTFSGYEDSNQLKGGHHQARRGGVPIGLQIPGMTLGLSDLDYIPFTAKNLLNISGDWVDFFGAATSGYPEPTLCTLNTKTGEFKTKQASPASVFQQATPRPSGGYLTFGFEGLNHNVVVSVISSFDSATIYPNVSAPLVINHTFWNGAALIGSKVYVGTDAGNKLLVFDADSGNYLEAITIASAMYRMQAYGGKIYGYDYIKPEVTIFNATDKTIYRLNPGYLIASFVINNLLFTYGSDWIRIYNATTNALVNEITSLPGGIENAAYTPLGGAFLIEDTDKLVQYRAETNTFHTLTVGAGDRQLFAHTIATNNGIVVTNSTNKSIVRIKNTYGLAPSVSTIILAQIPGYVGFDQSYAYVFSLESDSFYKVLFNVWFVDSSAFFEREIIFFQYIDNQTMLMSNGVGTLVYNQNANIYQTHEKLQILREGIGGNKFIDVWDSKDPPLKKSELKQVINDGTIYKVDVGEELEVKPNSQHAVYKQFENEGLTTISSGSNLLVIPVRGISVVKNKGMIKLKGQITL